ncbi:MAG: DUF5011 domain-containing protein [Blautia sp.]|uniref:immunoglobulin-like domain-containing protein n=1 Tax=Blautia sp. TaxID=1955243 RepID=UPI002A7658D2|nr:immunoglobulin-like domain-containing protein [Blautia sp.]MDY3016763.1 DUF5011 domain-containing protein [Blautia sp.]
MKNKLITTFLLLIFCAGAVTVALKSYDNINRNLQSAHDVQEEREAKLSVTPTPVPATPTPEPVATPTEVPADPAVPVLTLSEETIEIAAGSNFSVISPVAEITDDKDDRSSLFRRIHVSGDYSMTTPGQYVLQYVVTDSDGNSSIPKSLTLIVK